MDNIIELDNEGYDNDRAMAQDAEPLSSDEQEMALLDKDIKDDEFLVDNLNYTIRMAMAQLEKAKNRIEISRRLKERLKDSRLGHE